MVSNKYVVLKTRDIRELLNPEQQQQLASLLTTMTTARMQKNPQARIPLYFTINMEEKYAVSTVESYIQAIESDDANMHNQGVKDARENAVSVRQYAILNFDGTKLPD